MPRLLIAASGTGGHLFPALAVAKALPENWKIKWLGVPDRLETELIPNLYDLTTVRAGGLKGKGISKFFRLIRLLFATRAVCSLIKQEQIEAVFTTGGYISAPAILAARWCGLPVVLHESNAIPGRVTRFMGWLCNVVALGIPHAASKIPRSQNVFTGTPIRQEFISKQPLPAWVPNGPGPLLVVMGGSQGALGMNQMVRAVLPKILSAGCRVVHLTGSNDQDCHRYPHPQLIERPFTEEVAGLLQHADLAISRAGAGSLSELAMTATPAILIPFPEATDQHQEANASYAAQFGAAVILHQDSPENPSLSEVLWRLLIGRIKGIKKTSDPLTAMEESMKQISAPNAAQKLVKILNQLI